MLLWATKTHGYSIPALKINQLRDQKQPQKGPEKRRFHTKKRNGDNSTPFPAQHILADARKIAAARAVLAFLFAKRANYRTARKRTLALVSSRSARNAHKCRSSRHSLGKRSCPINSSQRQRLANGDMRRLQSSSPLSTNTEALRWQPSRDRPSPAQPALARRGLCRAVVPSVKSLYNHFTILPHLGVAIRLTS
jgi:hypothetical protein